MACVMAVVTAGAVVKPGVEVLRDGGFAQLQGKRVGLVTNPSGIDNNLKSTVDILNEAPGVQLVALFGPEHGVRGNAHAGDAVGDAVDPLTGIKMYSLFGKTHEPTAEMLKDIDGDHYYLTNEQYTYILDKYESDGIPTYAIYNTKGEQTFKNIGFPGNDVIRKELEAASK